MTSFLLATDLTIQSDRALGRALRMAGPADDLTVLHTLKGNPNAVGVDEERRKAEDRLTRMVAAQGASRPRVSVTVRLGDPAEEIAREAEDRGGEVVIVGAHRPSLLGDLFGAATAQKVADAGVASVLSVCEPANTDYRMVMVGVDLSPRSVRALSVSRTLLPQATLIVVHAFHVPFSGFLDSPQNRRDVAEQHRRDLIALIGEAGRRIGEPDLEDRVDLRLRDGEPTGVLAAEVRHAGPDLLVIGTGGSGNRLFGSVASAIAAAPPCDLLIVPSTGRGAA